LSLALSNFQPDNANLHVFFSTVGLLHHSTTINIRGESYRLKDRRKAGLVPPRGQEGAEVAARSLASDSVTPKTRQKAALGSTPSEAKEAQS
jgi:hypothetical protein